MFSLQPSDSLVFGIPTTSHGDQIREDLKSDRASMESNIISFGSCENKEETTKCTSNTMKKAIHREIERKRRQETSNLHTSLASLLPSYHNKRKGSASNQIGEAVNYIKQMQKNIEELRVRRDKLKKLSESHVGSSNNSCNSVAASLVDNGLEVLMSSDSRIAHTRVLAELVKRNFDVVCCDSITIEGKFIHKIRVEAAGNMTSLDVLVLENELTNAII